MLKKTMKTKIPLQVMMPLTAAMVCSMLCGCGMENGDYGYESSAPAAENLGERAEEMR